MEQWNSNGDCNSEFQFLSKMHHRTCVCILLSELSGAVILITLKMSEPKLKDAQKHNLLSRNRKLCLFSHMQPVGGSVSNPVQIKPSPLPHEATLHLTYSRRQNALGLFWLHCSWNQSRDELNQKQSQSHFCSGTVNKSLFLRFNIFPGKKVTM